MKNDSIMCDGSIYSLILADYLPTAVCHSILQRKDGGCSSLVHSSTNQVLYLPLFQFRIHNINYCRKKNLSLGAPYWVNIQNNIPELISASLRAKGIEGIARPLETKKDLKSLLLLHPKLVNWLQDPQNKEPHNDRTEREIIADELTKRGVHFDSIYQTSLSDEVAQKPISLERYLIKKLQIDTSLIQYKHYPLHRYYKKHFNIDLPINLNERSIYGEVDM